MVIEDDEWLAKNFFAVSNLRAHPFTGVVNKRAHGPIHRAVTNVIDEVLQDFAAARRVCDFGMKLQAVEFPLRIFHGGEGRAAGVSSDPKTSRQCSYFVTMTVPDVNLLA